MEQSEIDAMLKGMDAPESSVMSSKDDNGLQWDDVQKEMEQSKTGKPPVEVSAASFQEVQKSDAPRQAMDLDFILDIPLSLTVELGSNRMLISELLQLGPGSVIELSKLAGEPMDVFINQRLIARGEVVVINEKFGIRLTDIISPTERINKLK
jgi:flagellar motor switch protein FliN/FliY